jgi:hypothetical protein
MSRFPLAALLVLACATATRADELRLKDGSKVIGTIVGFEDNSFKVQTSYGYALVRKDMVVTVFISDSKKQAAPAPPPQSDSKATPPAPAAARVPPPADAAGAAAPVAAAPAAPPAPEPIREEVEGNSYVNHTYGFRIYKPPSWHVIEDARKMLPNALVAMGTSDETTLLVIGREPLRGPLEALADAGEQRLRETYDNYRALGSEHTTLSGLPAIERRFRGTVDEHDWSGRVVWLARGNQVLTLMGMTYSDSDLIQVQENVIARTIASLEFTKP